MTARALDAKIIKARLTKAEIRQVYQAIGVERFRSGGDGYLKCRSPLRRDSDNNPSFNVEAATGNWFDHATNENGDVFDAVRLASSCSFPEAVQFVAKVAGISSTLAPAQESAPSRRIVATYDYRDEKGERLYQVVRFDPKHFSQRKPDGRGGWTWSLNGVRRVLYRLPELVASDPSLPVFVVEGEKDADTLAAVGITATTGAMGAGKWREEYTSDLSDRWVVILPDNDDAGRQHAQNIAALIHGTASRVQVVELPRLPEKSDVSNWLDANNTVDDLLSMVNDAPEWSPEQEAPTFNDATEPDSNTVPAETVTLDDFRAYMPEHKYIFIPSREIWPASSVNARIGTVETWTVDAEGKPERIAASTWLDRSHPVETMTWVPGEPMLIRDRLMTNGGWVERDGLTTFNLYQPPEIQHGDPEQAGPWLDLVYKVYPDDAEQIIRWLAHRVQRPGEKINHALVFGGAQGIGKDTLLEPVKQAVGAWNFQEVSPSHLLGRFNGYVKSVILRVSEARDLGDTDRYAFYEHMKVYTAAPPDVLRVDEKNRHEYAVPNVCGVILTTNHKTIGLYLPADDRRHFVSWSESTAEDFPDGYWNDLYCWYEDGGYEHVAAYLNELDISGCDPKAPPPKTAAFWDIVDANRVPEDAGLADAVDALSNPPALTLAQVAGATDTSLSIWLTDRKNSRQIPHRMEAVGYTRVRNDAAKDGLWKLKGRRQAIYAKSDLSVRDRIVAAQRLVDR